MLVTTDFEAVGFFHKKFDLPTYDGTSPVKIDNQTRDFRLKFLMEEMQELAEAYGMKLHYLLEPRLPELDTVQDLPGVADALIDLVYVALGTAQLHKLPWSDLFDEVQRANMSKERAAADGSNSTRKSSLDVIKPVGFIPPRIKQVLIEAGWTPENE